MTTAQLQTVEAVTPDELLRARFVHARFEALAEWGISVADAHAIADCITVDIVEAVELLRQGCPASLIVPVLG